MRAMNVTLPIRAYSILNERGHWSERAKVAKGQRATAHMLLRAANAPKGLPVHVRVVRIAPRALDGHDNLGASLKNCIDGIADYFGVTDNDERIRFECAQEKGKPKEYAVRIEITETQGRSPDAQAESSKPEIALLGGRT